jgi:hypothetical protein
MRARSYVRPGWRRLLPRHAAAYGLQFEASILGSFHGAPHRFSNEGWHFDSSLFHVQYHSSRRGWSGLTCGDIDGGRILGL